MCIDRVEERAKSGGSRAMLPGKDADVGSQEQQKGPHWLRGSAAVLDADSDDSLRCARSGICEGNAACLPGIYNGVTCLLMKSCMFRLPASNVKLPACFLWHLCSEYSMVWWGLICAHIQVAGAFQLAITFSLMCSNNKVQVSVA